MDQRELVQAMAIGPAWCWRVVSPGVASAGQASTGSGLPLGLVREPVGDAARPGRGGLRREADREVVGHLPGDGYHGLAVETRRGAGVLAGYPPEEPQHALVVAAGRRVGVPVHRARRKVLAVLQA